MKRSLVSSHYLEVQANDSLTHVFSQMHNQDIHDVLIFDGKKFLGVLDRHLVHTVHTTGQAKIKKYVKAVKKVSLKLDAKDAVRLLLDNRVHALPVVDNKKIIGVVRAIDLVHELSSKSFLRKSLSTICSVRPLYFFEDTRLDKAMALLRTHHVDHAPIVDTHLRLTGVVSLTDLETHYIAPQKRIGGKNRRLPLSRIQKQQSSGAFPIVNFASSPAIATTPDDTVRSALSIMDDHHISSIVLTEKKDIVGILTLTDLLRAVLAA